MTTVFMSGACPRAPYARTLTTMMRGFGKTGKTSVILDSGVSDVHDLWHH